LHLPPFQPIIIFMMVFLAVLLIFSSKTSKFRHSVTKKRQLLGTSSPRPLPGLCPWTPPGPPPFAHSKYATVKDEDPAVCIPCNSLLTVEHILISCIDFDIFRQHFHTASNLKDLFHNIHPKRIISFIHTTGLTNKR